MGSTSTDEQRRSDGWAGIRRRRLRVVLAATAVCALPFAGAPAGAQTTYTVTARVDVVHSLGPVYEAVVSPPLPAGGYVDGRLTCTSVVVGPTVRPMPPDPASPWYDLPAGSYQLLGCRPRQGEQLQLIDATGNVITGNVVVASPGTATIRQANSALQAAVAVNPSTPAVAFSVQVVNAVSDSLPIPGLPLIVEFEDANGLWPLAACRPTTPPRDGNGESIATCVLTGQEAAAFFGGTGVWTATFRGDGRFRGSSAGGRVAGTATTTEQAAINREIFFANPVTIIAEQVPANCHTAPSETTTSLIAISVDQLDCTQLKVLKILSGVAVGIALGPGQAAASGVALVGEGILLTQSLAAAAPNLIRAAATSVLAV